MNMKIELNGKARKIAAKAIGQALNTTAKYLGTPTCAYQVGPFTLTKDADLVVEPTACTGEDLLNIDQALKEAGITLALPESLTEPQHGPDTALDLAEGTNTPAPQETDAIALPANMTPEQYQNLINFVTAKAELFATAFGVPAEYIRLEKEVACDTEYIRFPWFGDLSVDTIDADTFKAYIVFVKKMMDFVKSKKRITAKPCTMVNPKYQFRCILLRLGFIGKEPEIATARKILMSKLEGDGAHLRSDKE